MIVPEYDSCDYNSCKISSRRDFQKGAQSSSARTLCTRGTSDENKPYRVALCTEIGKPLTIQQLSRKPLSDGQVGHSVNRNIDIFELTAFSDTQVFSVIEQYKLKYYLGVNYLRPQPFLRTLVMVKIIFSLKIFYKVRLRIHSAGVNFGDILMVQGQYQEKPQLPFTPGLLTPTFSLQKKNSKQCLFSNA